MKFFIQKIINKFGYQLNKISSENTSAAPKYFFRMGSAMKWLAEHDVEIDTVVDVGASNGMWSKKLMNYYPNAQYYLFEPQESHRNLLQEFEKQYPTAVIVNKAVGNEDGFTQFNAQDPFSGALATEFDEGRAGFVKVPITKLDTAIPSDRSNLLIKLDTHGFEKSILDGASSLFTRTNALIIEVYNYKISDECLLFWELCQYLQDRGFRPAYLMDLCNRDYDHSFWQMDILFIRDSHKCFTVNSYT